MDLEQYKFTNDNRHSILEVQRSERGPLAINNPSYSTLVDAVATESGITMKEPGVLVSMQTTGNSTKRKAEASQTPPSDQEHPQQHQ